MGRLLEALKKKYKRPQDALRALGLDERLLTGDVVHSRSDDEYFHRGRDINDPLAGMDRHRRRTARDTFGLPSGTAGIAPKRESMPPQRLSSEAEDDLEDFREHLRRHMSEDQVEEACELSRDYMRRRSANGHDRRRVSRDEFPRNAVRSSEREAPSRGHWASPRPADQFADGSTSSERWPDGAMDAARPWDRITVEADTDPRKIAQANADYVARRGRRLGMDKASETNRRKFLEMFPDAARIEQA